METKGWRKADHGARKTGACELTGTECRQAKKAEIGKTENRNGEI